MSLKNLITVLESVQPGLSRKEIIQQSNTFLFSGGCVQTFNDEMRVLAPLPNEFNELEGSVPAEPFYQILLKAPDNAKFKITAKEISLVAKGFKAGVRRQQLELIPEIGTPEEWAELPENFGHMIGVCIFSTSKDPHRPLLNCVHVTQDAVQSCDNYRMTVFPIEDGPETDLLIPNSYAKHLINYPVTEYAETSGWLHFRTGNHLLFSCRTYGETYPDLSRFISKEGVLTKLPTGLRSTLDSAGIFLEADHKMDDAVTITLEDGSMEVSSEGSAGWFSGKEKLKYKGDSMTFRMNPHLLKDILSVKAKVRIRSTAMQFETAEFTHVISPSNPK